MAHYKETPVARRTVLRKITYLGEGDSLTIAHVLSARRHLWSGRTLRYLIGQVSNVRVREEHRADLEPERGLFVVLFPVTMSSNHPVGHAVSLGSVSR